ncbi:hypothetical protein V498_09763 [Pseudogymnoascus sp. VKM F-4517 (FW-2822)]|nr:hypothetical protein V498_09763 [Pseudogymnoascus sp. VKM F-4517 (FW-2822)]
MPLREIQQQAPRREIKDLDAVVITPADEPAGDGIDVQGPHKDFMRVDDAEADARAAVVAELRAGESLGVPRELADAPPGIDVPQADAEIAAAAHDDVVAELDGVDRPGVAVEVAVEGAGGAVEDGDGAVFGAGDYVFIVECEVKDGGGVVLEAADGGVGVGDGVDDACSVRGAGDEDGGVVLEAEDRRVVVSGVGERGGRAVAGSVGVEALDTGGGLGGGDFGVVGWGAMAVGEEVGGGDDGRGADDEEAFVGVGVPDAEGFVAGAGDNFVSVEG